MGNPNSGKSSLFNALTGLNQQVGNFPGVTVDKMVGTARLGKNTQASIIDLPGTYSLYPRREDEWVAYKVLMGADAEVKPDLVLLVADASNLKRNLLFCSQIIDLRLPVVMALTMNDLALKRDIYVDVAGLAAALHIPVVVVNPRKNKGLSELKKVLLETASNTSERIAVPFYDAGNNGKATGKRPSYGTYNVMWQVEWARKLKLPYLYLGYWIKDSQKMAYKQNYQPLEKLINGDWVKGE